MNRHKEHLAEPDEDDPITDEELQDEEVVQFWAEWWRRAARRDLIVRRVAATLLLLWGLVVASSAALFRASGDVQGANVFGTVGVTAAALGLTLWGVDPGEEGRGGWAGNRFLLALALLPFAAAWLVAAVLTFRGTWPGGLCSADFGCVPLWPLALALTAVLLPLVFVFRHTGWAKWTFLFLAAVGIQFLRVL